MRHRISLAGLLAVNSSAIFCSRYMPSPTSKYLRQRDFYGKHPRRQSKYFFTVIWLRQAWGVKFLSPKIEKRASNFHSKIEQAHLMFGISSEHSMRNFDLLLARRFLNTRIYNNLLNVVLWKIIATRSNRHYCAWLL